MNQYQNVNKSQHSSSKKLWFIRFKTNRYQNVSNKYNMITHPGNTRGRLGCSQQTSTTKINKNCSEVFHRLKGSLNMRARSQLGKLMHLLSVTSFLSLIHHSRYWWMWLVLGKWRCFEEFSSWGSADDPHPVVQPRIFPAQMLTWRRCISVCHSRVLAQSLQQAEQVFWFSVKWNLK